MVQDQLSLLSRRHIIAVLSVSPGLVRALRRCGSIGPRQGPRRGGNVSMMHGRWSSGSCVVAVLSCVQDSEGAGVIIMVIVMIVNVGRRWAAGKAGLKSIQ